MRDGDERGGAFALHGAQDFGGICRRLEDDSGAEQRRNEDRYELSKDVAEWNERDETERVKPALVFAIRIDAAFKRLEIGEEVAVREDDAARLGGGAGGEENLCDVVFV